MKGRKNPKKIIVALLIATSFLTLVMIDTTAADTDFEKNSIKTNYFEKLTIVESRENTFIDDYTYLATIPTCIYYAGNEKYVSSLVFDDNTKNERYLIEDIAKTWGGNTQITTIGNIDNTVIDEYKKYSQVSGTVKINSQEDSIFAWSAEIAESNWDESEYAVIVPIIETEEYVKYVQSASNGAIIASLKNCPLLFTNNKITSDTEQCLRELSVEKTIIITTDGFSSTDINQKLNDMNIDVDIELNNIKDIISYIRSLQNTNYLTLLYNNEEEREKPYEKEDKNKNLNKNKNIDDNNKIFNMDLVKTIIGKVADRPIFKKLVSFLDRTQLVGGHISASSSEKLSDLNFRYTKSSLDDKEEMPFGPAALIGAFHAGPVLTFPTENIHSQRADDYAEFIGNWMYDIFDHNKKAFINPIASGKKDTPNFNEMKRISTEFYKWLSDIGADGSGTETIITVADLDEIDPSLDRALFGKSITGRICSGNAGSATCIVNRNVLYPQLIESNPGKNDMLMSFIAYSVDDTFTDSNGETHNNIDESKGTSEAFENAGYNLNYDTTLNDMTNSLSNGVKYWVNVGHAYYGKFTDFTDRAKPVVGEGTIAYWKGYGQNDNPSRGYEKGGSPEDPDQYTKLDKCGKPVGPPDGRVFDKCEQKTTPDAYTNEYLSKTGNLHSASMYWLLCNIGGCQGPALFQKSGASVIVSSYASVTFSGGGWFDVRLNQELANGATFGEAVLTALRETSSIYSEGKQGPDDTLQYIIFGDPSISLDMK